MDCKGFGVPSIGETNVVDIPLGCATITYDQLVAGNSLSGAIQKRLFQGQVVEVAWMDKKIMLKSRKH